MQQEEQVLAELERRLVEIRQDPERLMRYDRNGDGKIDAEEWAEVRRVVEAEIRGELARRQRGAERHHTVPGAVLEAAEPEILEVIRGRYEVLQKIGQGSQGQAFVGRDRQSNEAVLIKEMRMTQVQEWKAVELFEREARTLESLSHEAIPRFIDAFHVDADLANPADLWAPGAAGMRFFLVQEFIEGSDLQDLIDSGLMIDEAGARAFLREMLGVLDYLHSRREPVIHRDIKPANIIRRTDRRLVLVDFGAVQSADMAASVKYGRKCEDGGGHQRIDAHRAIDGARKPGERPLCAGRHGGAPAQPQAPHRPARGGHVLAIHRFHQRLAALRSDARKDVGCTCRGPIPVGA